MGPSDKHCRSCDKPVCQVPGIGTNDCQIDTCELLMDSDLHHYFIWTERDVLHFMKLASKSINTAVNYNGVSNIL